MIFSDPLVEEWQLNPVKYFLSLNNYRLSDIANDADYFLNATDYIEKYNELKINITMFHQTTKGS